VNAPALVSPGHRFWPVGEAAQADYEALRAQVLATGAAPDTLAAARFTRRGLPGLIAWPSTEPVFDAALLGASRPPWTPHADPRLDALAAGFALLLNASRINTGRDAGRDAAAVPVGTVTAPNTRADMIKELPG
jgi:hypothetical protein